jgi:hypothetical protein
VCREARYAAQKLAFSPQVRETAGKAARVAVNEAEEIAGRDDVAFAPGVGFVAR